MREAGNPQGIDHAIQKSDAQKARVPSLPNVFQRTLASAVVGLVSLYSPSYTHAAEGAPTESSEVENLCGLEDMLPSKGGDATTSLTLINPSSKPLTLFWKSTSGEEVSSNSLEPWSTQKLQTIPTRLWVVRDQEGKCLFAGYPREEPAEAKVAPEEELPTQVGSREIESSPRFVPETRGIPLSEVAFFPDAESGPSWTKEGKGFAVKGGMLEAFRSEAGKSEALGRPLSQSWTDAEGYENQVFEYGILSVSGDGEITMAEADGAAVKREGKLIPAEALAVQFIEDGKLIEPYETYGSLAQGLRIDYEVMRPGSQTIKLVPVGEQEERELLEFIQRELKEDPETSAPSWIHIVDIGHPIFQPEPGAGRKVVFLGPGQSNPPVFDDNRVNWMQEDGNSVPYGPGYAPIHRTRPIVAYHQWVAISQDVMRSEIVDNPAVRDNFRRNNIDTGLLLSGIWPHEHKWDFQVQKYKFTVEWYRTDGSGPVSRL